MQCDYMPGSRKHAKKPEWQLSIAKERIGRLFALAESEFDSHPERSHKYVLLARKLAMRYNIRLPRELRRRSCRKCFKYLKPTITCRIRTSASQQAVIITCLECGNIMRFPYRKEKSAEKSRRAAKAIE